MASARGHKRSVGGFFSNVFRGLFSSDSPGRAEPGRERKGAKPRLLRFEGCEQRQLLSVTAVWHDDTGVLNLTGDTPSESVSVIGQSSYVDIYVSGRYQARITNASSSEVGTITFDGGGGSDSLTVQNIQPTAGTLAVTLTGVDKVSILKGSSAAVTADGGLSLGTSDLKGALTVSITSPGDLTQSGAVVVGGATTLTVDAASDITLTQSKNNFNSVAVTAGNNVSLVDVNSLILGASTVSGNLSVQASMSSSSRGTLSQSGVLDVDGNTTLAVGRAGTITLLSANLLGDGAADTVSITSAGNASLRNDSTNGTKLAASNVTGNFTLDTSNAGATGHITQSGGLVVGKVATFKAGTTYDITLDHAGNNFGTVAITSGRDVTLRDINAMVFNASAVSRDLTVTAGGQITQKGAIVVAGDTVLNAGSANNITLSNAANNFGATANDSLSIAGRNVTLRNADALDLAASTVTGTFSVTAGGAITDSGALNVTGKMTLAAGAANDITLDGNNSFSEVVVTSGKDVAIRDTAAGLALGKSKISGTLNVTASGTGALTQTGALTVTGATTLDVGAGDDIALTTASNNFSSVAVTTGNNVSLADTNALKLGASQISGNLRVTAKGNVEKTAANTALSVSGTTSVSVGRANTITLAGTNTTFAQSVSVTGGTVTLSNTAATEFDAVNVTNNLTVDSTGAVSQAVGGGAMVVGRTAAFTSPGNITLDNANNNFYVAALNGAAVTLADKDSVALGASAVTGALNVTAGKAISQTGALAVTGAAAFVAGPSAKDTVVLNNSANNFQAAVSVTAGGNVTLADQNAIILGASAVDGALSVTTGDANITQTGALDVGGKTTLAAGTGNVVLDLANDFARAVSVTSANDATLRAAGALLLGRCTVDNNLTVDAAGDISQSDSIVAGGTADLDATGFDITLTLDGNDFEILKLAGADVAVADGNALVLGASAIGGSLVLTTSGDITENGAEVVRVDGTMTLAAGTGNIDLGANSHHFNKVTIESAYDVLLNDDDSTGEAGLVLGTSSVRGALTISADGTVSQDGPLSATGTVTVTAGGEILLNEAQNAFHTVVATGTNVTLCNDDDIDLGGVTASGDLVVDVVGQITDSAATSVGGASSFTARTAGGLYNDIVLNELGSDYGSLSLEGHDVLVENDADLTLGSASASGDLTIHLSGGKALTNTPGSNMSIAGKTVLKSAGAGGSIDLYTVGCVFGSWDPNADPWDNPSLDLYLEAETVTVNP